MGENLALREREAIRTPMQWDASPNAGFSRARAEDLVAPLIDHGEYGYQRVNVTDQRRDPQSLLTWFERMLHSVRECEEIGSGNHEILDVGPPHVLVHPGTGRAGTTVFLHNLADRPCRIVLGSERGLDPKRSTDSDYGDRLHLNAMDLRGYGYRWIRVRTAP
jgi:maltose alpha-D-glucosyltransferase / alpha-amylase